MWTPEQKRDKEIPYRGEPSRKFSKRRRQIRELQAKKRKNIITLLVVFVFLTSIPICIIFNPYSNNGSKDLNQVVAIVIVALILIIPIASGLFSINKFRKGYDIDRSDKAKEDSNNNHDEPDKALD